MCVNRARTNTNQQLAMMQQDTCDKATTQNMLHLRRWLFLSIFFGSLPGQVRGGLRTRCAAIVVQIGGVSVRRVRLGRFKANIQSSIIIL